LNLMLQIIFITSFILLFAVVISILKPFRIHRKRKFSTIFLKVSYLVYLVIFLLLAYLVLFNTGELPEKEKTSGKNPLMIYYVAVILAFIIPNLGIIFRRKFNKFRSQYNVIFTGLNLLTVLVLAFIIYIMPWEF